MVVGKGSSLKFNWKYPVVVGLLLAVILLALVVASGQEDANIIATEVSNQASSHGVNPGDNIEQYGDIYFEKVDMDQLFALDDVNIGGGTDYTSTQSADEVNITLEGHLGGLIEACAVSGNYAFIGKGQDFVVLDISNPASPSVLGKLITSGFVNDISVLGKYAYIVNNNGNSSNPIRSMKSPIRSFGFAFAV